MNKSTFKGSYVRDEKDGQFMVSENGQQREEVWKEGKRITQ